MNIMASAGHSDGHFFGSVTVGESGQVVIPKEAREAFDIKPGQKLVVFGKAGGVGLIMVKAESMRDFASKILKSI